MGNSTLFVGSHPDDIELGCGGLVSRLTRVNRNNVSCVFVTSGERGVRTRGEEWDYSGRKEEREEESIAACTLLGVLEDNITFLRLPDTRLDLKIVEIIGWLEKGVVPTTVFVPSFEDYHQDHRSTFNASCSAFRTVPNILSYETPSTRPDFVPNCFVDISSEINRKVSAVTHHHSQVRLGRSYMKPDRIRGQAAFRGVQGGMPFAEAFCVIRSVMVL